MYTDIYRMYCDKGRGDNPKFRCTSSNRVNFPNFGFENQQRLLAHTMEKKSFQPEQNRSHSSVPRVLNEAPRRYYTPRTILEQVVNTYPSEIYQAPRRILKRNLGGIELMYNKYASQGTDIVCLSTTVESIYPILPDDAEKAWLLLLQRHPLLRMRITKDLSRDKGHLQFVERRPLEHDFEVVEDNTTWLQYILRELEIPFLANCKSLIRLRMLKTKRKSTSKHLLSSTNLSNRADTFQYETTFVFLMHHSVMDGGYSLWMFQELMNFIDAVVNNVDIKVKELPLLPPMEEYFRETLEAVSGGFNVPDYDEHTSGSSIKFCHDSTDDQLLKQYNKTFRTEIDTKQSSALRNGCHVFKFTESDSRKLARSCKFKQCSPKGAFTAASILALIELVYQNDASIETACKNINVPIEFMFDFRRCGGIKYEQGGVPHYPGVAAFHIPLVAQLRLTGGKLTQHSFWDLARLYAERIDSSINAPAVYRWIQNEAAKYKNNPNQREEPGKSPYVLSISNMGRCDGVLNEDISKRIKLVDLHGHSSIMIDQMPLFFLTTFSLNGQICGNVSYCLNYTSDKTASKYVGLIQKYLLANSNI
ncbi:hypothetical protein ACF0H5_014346 [Mactra antiquata]